MQSCSKLEIKITTYQTLLSPSVLRTECRRRTRSIAWLLLLRLLVLPSRQQQRQQRIFKTGMTLSSMNKVSTDCVTAIVVTGRNCTANFIKSSQELAYTLNYSLSATYTNAGNRVNNVGIQWTSKHFNWDLSIVVSCFSAHKSTNATGLPIT